MGFPYTFPYILPSTSAAVTMATSSAGGLILGMPASAAAIDAQGVRVSLWQSIANNINHTADERSRVLVAHAQRSTTLGGVTSQSGYGDLWAPVLSFGPFPLLIDAVGRSYPIRLRVGGHALKAHTIKFRIGVCLVGRANSEMSQTSISLYPNIIESASFTDSTSSWRVGGLVSPPVSHTSVDIVNAVGGAQPASITQVLCTVECWAHGPATDGVVTQAYAAEIVSI